MVAWDARQSIAAACNWRVQTLAVCGLTVWSLILARLPHAAEQVPAAQMPGLRHATEPCAAARLAVMQQPFSLEKVPQRVSEPLWRS